MLQISDLSFRYPGTSHPQLRVASLSLARGDHMIVLGPSGCGKSTLLHLIAGVLKPQEGTLRADGIDIGTLSPRAADAWRGKTIGFLPQKLALIPSLSARDNVLLAAYANGTRPDHARADTLLDALGLTQRAQAKPHMLSQGQRQRVAIARAIYNRPAYLLADEPTANLDDAACAAAIGLLKEQAAGCSASLVIATHDARVPAALPDASLLRLGHEAVLQEVA